MKTKVLLLAAALGLLSGCAFTQRTLYQPKLATNQVAAHVEVRTTLTTNLIPIVVTNSSGVSIPTIFTNVVQTVAPVYWPAGFTVVTNGWEVAPGVETGVAVAGGVANIFAPGIGSAAAYVLSGLLSLGLLYLNRKQQTANDLNVGLVQAVESFRQGVKLTPLGAKIDDHLINTIKSHIPEATAVGALLASLVDAHTGNTATNTTFVKSMTQVA